MYLVQFKPEQNDISFARMRTTYILAVYEPKIKQERLLHFISSDLSVDLMWEILIKMLRVFHFTQDLFLELRVI